MGVDVLLTLFRMGLSGAAHWWKGEGKPKRPPIPNMCYKYHTMMKLDAIIPYLEKIQKYINYATQPMSPAEIFFHRKSANIARSRNTDID